MNPLLSSQDNGAWGNASPLDAAGGLDALAKAYLARYPDVAASQYAGNPIEHYQRWGQNEGRVWDAPTPATLTPDPAVEAAKQIPAYQAPGDIYGNSADAWSNFGAQARASTEGMNRMPGVFSNFGAVPTDPATANALFYPPPSQDGGTGNPLLDMIGGWINATRETPPAQRPVLDTSENPDAFGNGGGSYR